MSKQEKIWYISVFRTLVDQNGIYGYTDEQAINAMALTDKQFDMILDGMY